MANESTLLKPNKHRGDEAWKMIFANLRRRTVSHREDHHDSLFYFLFRSGSTSYHCRVPSSTVLLKILDVLHLDNHGMDLMQESCSSCSSCSS